MSANEREPGATFAPGDICFCDFETRSPIEIAAGSDRYARQAQAVMLAWAVGDGDVSVEVVTDFPASLQWRLMPEAFKEFFWRVDAGEAVLCAHNAAFDRAIWNNATDFPPTEPWMWIDSMVQARASGLPAALDGAARYAGGLDLKDKAGSALIDLFTLPDFTATPLSHPDEWAQFGRYAARDVGAMRSVFMHTRQLPLAEWKEYWAAEAINDRGICIDIPMVTAAAKMAAVDADMSGKELSRLTRGAVFTVNQVARMTAWLNTVLPPDGRDLLVKKYEEVDLETGELLKPRKEALTRDRVVRLLAYLDGQEPLPAPLRLAQRVLQIRMYGGSKTPAKFGRMLQQNVDGVIRNQYVFNGAPQTGRFSAKGIQVHNLARDPLPYEIDAVDALLANMPISAFAELGDDTPVSRKLSLLIRPSLVPERDTTVFVWGDWSNIEARLVPWLADDPEAEKRLDIFRAVDAGKERYDVYTRTAAQLSNVSLEQAIVSEVRQRGKVVELACGFGGSTNALLSMAAGYGIHLEEEVATAFVKQWREDNRWAVRFWGKHDEHSSYGLWGALNQAIERPGDFVEAGRVGYVYLKGYLGGSLLCRLPSGRFLTYRRIKWERVEELDDDGVIVAVRRELMFSRDQGRVKLWPGLACENVVQACAADLLRGTLVRLDSSALADWMPVRLHTHDEILTETRQDMADDAAYHLRAVMEDGFEWSSGLPIAAETVKARWYSKSKKSFGL